VEPVSGQRHDRDGADPLQSEVQVSELNDVGQLHDDTVKWLEPFIEKVQRQTLGAFVELGVGNGLLAIDDRDAIRVFSEDLGKNIPQGTIFPISFGSIPGRKLGRKPNDAL
jgi:hypothetical protein